jgi:hypothetical protein
MVTSFPQDVQGRIDALVVLMNDFRKFCTDTGIEASERGIKHKESKQIDGKTLEQLESRYDGILDAADRLKAELGEIYPTLKEAVSHALGTHANDVFRFIYNSTNQR